MGAMKRSLLGLTLTTGLLLTSSMVDARTLMAQSGWSVNKVASSDVPYCTMLRQYEGDVTLTFAKNTKNEGTIAIDFKRDAFDVTRPYPIKIKSGAIARQFNIKPASQGLMILRTGQDEALFDSLKENGQLSLTIDNEQFNVDMAESGQAFDNLYSCLGVAKPPRHVDAKIPVPPSLPVPERPIAKTDGAASARQQERLSQQNEQIEALLGENRQLQSRLNQWNATEESAQDVSLALREQLSAAQRRNTELLSHVNELEQQLSTAKMSINPDMSGVVAERERQIDILSQQNADLRIALDMEYARAPEVITKEVVREVPVVDGSVQSQVEMLQKRLNSAEIQKNAIESQRDQYQNLVQAERERYASLQNELQVMKTQQPAKEVVVKEVPVEVIKEVEVPVVKEVIREVPVVDASAQAQVNDLSQKITALEQEKIAIEVQKERLQSLLQSEQTKMASLQNELNDLRTRPTEKEVVVKEVPVVDGSSQERVAQLVQQIASMEQQQIAIESQRDELQNRLQEQQSQIASLQSEVQELRTRPVEKEVVVREMPTASSGDNGAVLAMQQQLAEQETLAQTYKAERDEYQRLLQIERQREREVATATTAEEGLAARIRQLENDKVELIRELEFAKSQPSTNPVSTQTPPPAQNAKLEAMNKEIAQLRADMVSLSDTKKNLEIQLQAAQQDIIQAKRQTASAPVASVSRQPIPVEQRPAPAQTQQMAMAPAPTAPENTVTDRRISQPIDLQDESIKSDRPAVATAVNSPSSPPMQKQPATTATQMAVSAPPVASAAPSVMTDDTIEKLVTASRIPLQSAVDLVDRLSGPDYAAWRWQAENVYGTAEESRMSNPAAFDQSIQNYIKKTRDRCDASFDESIRTATSAGGIQIKVADIACVNSRAEGAAASILFFTKGNTFYAIAHEADMNTFQTAMDFRDKLAATIDGAL